MNEVNSSYTRTASQVIVRQNTLIRQVYAWMGVGLAITAFMALVTLSSPAILAGNHRQPAPVLRAHDRGTGPGVYPFRRHQPFERCNRKHSCLLHIRHSTALPSRLWR